MSKAGKFSDEGKIIYDFGDEFLVVCPRCGEMAKVMTAGPDSVEFKSKLFALRSLVCLNCVCREQWQGGEIRISANADWYFGLPLWLQIPCCGKTLSVYNEKHLDFLEDYVGAKLRARTPNINKSLASRLPQWLKSAKNRDEILKCLKRLRTKLI